MCIAGSEMINMRVDDAVLDRAIRLFAFLARVQQLKSQPLRTVDAYQRSGSVSWFAELPLHSAVTSAHRSEPQPGEPLLAVDRVPRAKPPEPSALLAPWLLEPLAVQVGGGPRGRRRPASARPPGRGWGAVGGVQPPQCQPATEGDQQRPAGAA